MKTPRKLEKSFQQIEAIRYENENGGAYAYLQFMAYTRDLLVMLRPVKKAERQAEAIEAINWLFNEYLAIKFTPSHRLIFEEKKAEIKKIFQAVRELFHEEGKLIRKPFDGKLYHAQAA